MAQDDAYQGDNCSTCGERKEWTRYKDVPLHFESTTKYVTVMAWYCSKCNEMHAEID